MIPKLIISEYEVIINEKNYNFAICIKENDYDLVSFLESPLLYEVDFNTKNIKVFKKNSEKDFFLIIGGNQKTAYFAVKSINISIIVEKNKERHVNFVLNAELK